MSVAIHIVTHAPLEAVEKAEAAVAKIVADLNDATDEEGGPTQAHVYGTDFTGKKPKAVDRRAVAGTEIEEE